VAYLFQWLSKLWASRSSGEDGTATIVERRVTRPEDNEGAPALHKYVADVEVPGQSPFRTTIRDPALITQQYTPPQPGQVVRVKANAKRQTARLDPSDPSLHFA
jgi:hypothetical protein